MSLCVTGPMRTGGDSAPKNRKCGPYLFCAGKVEHSELSVHFFSFQNCLELFQIFHHHGISLKVREVVVNLVNENKEFYSIPNIFF